MNPAPVRVGGTISHYRITGKIGQGGMGVVYLAEDTRLLRPVALKFLPPDSVHEADKQRLRREAQAAALVHHPNICPIYDIDDVDGQLFFVMAYVQGETIRQKVESGALNLALVLDLGIQIASGLDAAHGAGIVHRDIKSNNVMVTKEGNAVILDFGLALRSGLTRLTNPGSLVGTPAYMSPEQALGNEVDRRTDIWALGIVLFEMLTGRLPFQRDHNDAVVHAILHDETPSIGGLRPEVPVAVRQAVEKALAKRPEDRWQTAGQFAAELRRIKAGYEATTQTIVSPAARTRPLSWKFIAAGAALVILAAVLVLRPWQPSLPAEKDLAVLPFRVIGSDENTQVVADGLVETLTTKLTQVEELQGKVMVVPASEIRARKISTPSEARKLYAATLAITGTAEKLTGRIHFNVNLVDASKLRQLRSRSFDFDSQNAIAMRDETVDGVVQLLEVQLTPLTKQGVAAGETTIPAAYEAYLEGRGYLATYYKEGNVDRAVESFERATQADPKYALAFAGLGGSYWWKALLTRDKQWSEKALRTTQVAVTLDPKLAAAHIRLGEIYAGEGRRDEAVVELKQALKLAPRSADAYRTLAETYSGMGRYSDAEAAYSEAIQLRPKDWYGHLLLGLLYLDQHRYEEAISSFTTAKNLTPENVVINRNLASAYMNKGRFGEATKELLAALQIQPTTRIYSTLGMAYYYQHLYPDAVKALERATQLGPDNYIAWGNLGTAYFWSGNRSGSEAAFHQAIELAGKSLELNSKDYSVLANLAEYYAKLGRSTEALRELSKVPENSRETFADHFILVYELTGQRAKALETIRSAFTQPDSLNEVRNDPYLAGLVRDPGFLR